MKLEIAASNCRLPSSNGCPLGATEAYDISGRTSKTRGAGPVGDAKTRLTWVFEVCCAGRSTAAGLGRGKPGHMGST